MKILYCGLKFDYGEAYLGYSFEHLNFFNTLKKMSSIKKLDYISIDETIRLYNKEYLNELIISYAKQNSYDLIFFFLFKDEIYETTLKTLKNELSTPTIAWMADDHWRFETYSKYWAKYFTLVVTTDLNSLKKYKDNNINNVILSQWGCNHYDYKPTINKKSYKVTFVGMAHGNRKNNINYLKKFNQIECWGNGWENKKIPFGQMVEIYSNSNINLNFSESSSQRNLKTFIKIFLSKSTKSSYKLNNLDLMYKNFINFYQKKTYQIKGRVFEVPACRGFLLTENCKNLDSYFEFDKEIVVFDTLEEANSKIKFFKNNLRSAETIAKRGYIRVINEHTYEKRFLTIFKKLYDK